MISASSFVERPSVDGSGSTDSLVHVDRLLSTWPIAAAFLTGTVYYTLTRAHASYLAVFGLGPSTFSHSIVDLAARDLFTLLLVVFFCVVSIVVNRLIVGEWLYQKIDGVADWTTSWLTATPARRRVSLPIAVALMPVLTLSLVVAVADATGGGRAQGVKSSLTSPCARCLSYADKNGKQLATGILVDQDQNRVAILARSGTIMLKLDDIGLIQRLAANVKAPQAKVSLPAKAKREDNGRSSIPAPGNAISNAG